MTNYSAMHHAEAAKRAAEGTDAEAASVGLEHSARTYALQAATSAAGTHFKLFHHDWFDYQLNDIAWLRADTFSWQDGTVYSEAYNHLVADMVGISPVWETIGSYQVAVYNCADGHKVCTPDQETTVANIYNESGVAWYYILDTANQRFKLPRENPAREELIQVVRAKGNGTTLGLTDGTSNAGLLNDQGGAANPQIFSTAAYGSSIGAGSSSSTAFSGYRNIGVATDATKSGIVSDMTDSTSVYKGKQYLYFYVGQFTQTATEQTAGLNSELFNGKADIDMGNVPANIGSTAKSYFAGIGMPSDTWENVSLPANGGYVIAPANGYYCISGTGQTLYLGIEDANGAKTLETWINNSGTFLPIYKGQKCIVGYSAAPSTFKFVYAQGEV